MRMLDKTSDAGPAEYCRTGSKLLDETKVQL